MQFELDFYKAHNNTKTSKDSFEAVKPKLKTRREQVYEFIKSRPATNYEISEELGYPLSSICARVRELQILGLVTDSGKRKTTPFGKTAIVWQSDNLTNRNENL